MDMKKSTGDNFFPKGTTFAEGLTLLKRAGFDGIELWLGDRPWFQMHTSDADLRARAKQIQDAGLVVSDIANILDWEENIASRDPARREAASRHIERQIEAAQIFATDAILIVAGVVSEETPYNEVYKRTVGTLQRLAEVAAKARVKIGVENCNSEQRFLLSPREFSTFLDEVNSPWVGIHLDVGNIHDTGFAEQWIEIHGPRITRIHVKDVLKHRGRCGDQSVYTNIFLGDNNWPAIHQAMRKVNYDGWLIAEMESRYRYAADQQVFDTAAALNRFIAGSF
jgi:L-ribulose-5-phosphate 3-epimerase